MAHDEGKAVGADVTGEVSSGDLAEVGERDALLLERAARAVVDGEVLDGGGVAVLESAVREAARLDAPAPADKGQGVRCRPVAFFEAIEGKVTLIAGRDGGQLLDLEIV